MDDDKKYDELANLFKIFTNSIRLKILDALITNCNCSIDKLDGCCVSEINDEIDLPQPYISKHLKVLKDNNILTYRRQGNKIIYDFAPNDSLLSLIEFLSKFKNCC